MYYKALKVHNPIIIVLVLVSLTSIQLVLGTLSTISDFIVPIALLILLPIVVLAPTLVLFPFIRSLKAGFTLVPSIRTLVPSLTTFYRL
jgi:hypothetical protein